MTVLVTGANGQLGTEMRIVSAGSRTVISLRMLMSWISLTAEPSLILYAVKR